MYSKPATSTSPIKPNFGYWFNSHDASSTDQMGDMRTKEGVRRVKELKGTVKTSVDDFFSIYKTTDGTNVFILRFLSEKLPGILVQCKQTFDTESPLHGREDLLAHAIQHIVPSFIKHAELEGFNLINLNDQKLVKNRITTVLQSVLSARNSNQSLSNPIDDIFYIVNSLNTTPRVYHQSPFSQFKKLIVDLTPPRIGTPLRKCISTCRNKLGPTLTNIKDFTSRNREPIEGLSAVGIGLFAWYYMPTIPEVSLEDIRSMYTDPIFYIGGAFGSALTVAVSHLFNRW